MKLRRLGLLALVLLLLWLGGFIWFLRAVQEAAADAGTADAIVVLTGGTERVETGFRLLEEGAAPRLFISGVHPDSRLADLARGAGVDWLHASLSVKAPAEGGHGLHGSGVFVFNPPWTLPGMLGEVLPVLKEALGQDARAATQLQLESLNWNSRASCSLKTIEGRAIRKYLRRDMRHS